MAHRVSKQTAAQHYIKTCVWDYVRVPSLKILGTLGLVLWVRGMAQSRNTQSTTAEFDRCQTVKRAEVKISRLQHLAPRIPIFKTTRGLHE